MTLERRAFGHDGTDDQAFDVLGLDGRHRVEAGLAGLPDQVPIRRLADAELRHARSDQRNLLHGNSPCSRRASAVWPWACAMSSAVWPSSLRAVASAPCASSSWASSRLPPNAASCSAVWPPA